MEPIRPLDPVAVYEDVAVPPPPVKPLPSPLAQALPRNRRLDVGGIVATAASVGLALLADPAGLEASVRRVVSAGSTTEKVLAAISLGGLVYAAATRAKR